MGFYFVNNSVITGITSKDSKNFHLMVYGCENITFDGVKVTTPADSTNTDGIHLGKSTDVKILNTDIATGDDCVSLGDGSRKVLIQNVNCGPGHGISVGSLGKFKNEDNVEGLRVKNCKMSDTDNGVRIKTWPFGPGTLTITDMRFEDITMNSVRNPIIIDQYSGVPCDGVELSNIDLKFNGKPAKAVCSNVKPKVSGNAPKCEAYTPPPSG
ncbi:unnamed protein product [Vicia faba]|uniref:Polygalacturonase n=1 Tax=Vicia faba TaxID=3906 RepID=A0AAV0YTV6_VICFA|nr:unnamed protein product [Vicia faba]